MTDAIRSPIRDAGYRERVFVKALLAAGGAKHLTEHWPSALDTFAYDPHDDVVVFPDGRRHKVSAEGSESLKILVANNLDDSDVIDRPDDARIREMVKRSLRKILERWRGSDPEDQSVRDMARAALWKHVAHMLIVWPSRSSHRGQPPVTGVVSSELGFVVLLPWGEPSEWEAAELEIPPTTAELEYLDDLAAVLLATPPGCEEEEVLRRAYLLASTRIGVDSRRHLEEATALSTVRDSKPPRLVRLVSALASALGPRDERITWTTDEPWADADATAEDFAALVAARAGAAAETLLGDAGENREHDEDVLIRCVASEALALGCELTSFDVPALRSAVNLAIASVRGPVG
jgi:hypothetical protein